MLMEGSKTTDVLQRCWPDATSWRFWLSCAGLDTDGKHIVFRANRTPYGKRKGRHMIAADGGMETRTSTEAERYYVIAWWW